MTTKVTVEVPDHATYRVEVQTSAPSGSFNTTFLDAGQRTEIYIHDGLTINSIKEVPVAPQE